MSEYPSPQTKASDSSKERDLEAYVYDPHNKTWITCKSLTSKPEVNKGSLKEENLTSASPVNELYSHRNEDVKDNAIERKLSDWLITGRGNTTYGAHRTRPIFDKFWKKKAKRRFGTTDTEQRMCESMKHFLDKPCLSLKSLAHTVSENGHRIHLDDSSCPAAMKDSPCRDTHKKSSGRNRGIIKRHMWQMVDEDGKTLPFGAVSSTAKDPNDGKQTGADIWIRLDCVSVLITKIMEDIKRDRNSSESLKSEKDAASQEEDNSSQENGMENSGFEEIPLETACPNSCPGEGKAVISSEVCCHETVLTESSTDGCHPNSLENASHEGSGDRTSEVEIADAQPESSDSQGDVSTIEMCIVDSQENVPSHRESAQDLPKESRRRRIFPRFLSLNFLRRRGRREQKKCPDGTTA